MTITANQLLDRARYWIGFNEDNGGHEAIINLYNQYRFHGCGYYMKHTGEWCAAFVSACAIRCKATDIIPVECHCNHMISLFKKIGVWIEDESVIPEPGDIVFYDWQDDGNGDNKESSDHVGIVESVDIDNKEFVVIEGNYDRSVKRRNLKFNQKYLRGFARPEYGKQSNMKLLINKCKIFASNLYRILKKH